MSTSTDANITAYWNNASSSMNRYFSIFLFLFGTIGNILNILVLFQRELRTNSCSFLFLISSIANLIAILSGLTTRMLSGWTLDLTNTIDWLCKLRAFILFVSRNIALLSIMFAALDRWLSSSINVHRRHMSTLKNAQRAVILLLILSAIIYSPIFYCYKANLINAPLKCYGETNICRISNDLIYACCTILFPILLMSLFGIMTINNIRHVQSRINITNSNERLPISKKKKVDRQLSLMLFIQIILLALFTLPQAIQKLYSTITANQILSSAQTAFNNFIFNLVLLLTYVANGVPFYIYTLSGGTVFRNALIQLFRKLNQIHP
ncbi:unnamed protein product [Adineta steineri]|uniref:G-protein coupled receptors family 1 profile domain-containing protein n=1 Tax=Adineta steineri TaxID=433720 RepID=A0A818TR13_9BILA|nr:unnamed protein product [Adineta steineri]CAF3685690.1 unnamed protein product [Adineta steineri]